MTRLLLTILLVFLTLNTFAQLTPEFLDYHFKVTSSIPRYLAYTEKRDTGWYQEVFFWPEKTMAKSGWFSDERCTIAHGPQTTFDMTGYLYTRGNYTRGKKNGVWLTFNNDGYVVDSTNYNMGQRTGICMSYYRNGYMADSCNFDQDGNGVEVAWYDDGTPRHAGAWVQDTLKNNRWVYFFRNGQRMATEDYKLGKKLTSACYDSSGKALGECEEKESIFSENEPAWVRFVERNLRPDVPVKMGAPVGNYTIFVRFMVTAKGELENFFALTKFGYGMEAEVIRMLKKSPDWIPAKQFGRPVNAYRVQPVTFSVTQE